MKEKFAPNWKEVKTVPASQTNAHIEGLREGDDYVFRIVARNKGQSNILCFYNSKFQPERASHPIHLTQSQRKTDTFHRESTEILFKKSV